MSLILAIESSCDDTGAAIIHNGKILSNRISTQPIHKKMGGVVPELASRDHHKNIVYVVRAALEEAGIGIDEIDAFAVTAGPGLLGSLVVGLSFIKGMALAKGKPIIEVDHLRAHILAHFIENDKPDFPFNCLLVSGGHTEIVQMSAPDSFTLIGKTIDDAAGEAFDKGAKLLGLPYPGGPMIDKLAKKGDPHRFLFNFPEAGGFNYSFSGLKTALLYKLKAELKSDKGFIEKNLEDLCASWQYTLVEYLLDRFRKALIEHPAGHIGIAGGVAANSYLRARLNELATELGVKAYIPDFSYCVDNAAMIAKAAEYKFDKGEFAEMNLKPFTRHNR